MARNVEIKARIEPTEFEELRQRAATLATEGPIQLLQTDTFFYSQIGRLKLREFGDGSAELIFYERPDCVGPKISSYTRSPCPSPETIKESLGRANGILGIVKKQREVFFVKQTRVHLDRVEGLGTFLELEVVLNQDDSEEMGEQIAGELLLQLGVDDSQLIPGAYLDLILIAP
jgi:adenylate cyclase class IV